MNIYTYYEKVPQMKRDNQLELIEIWEKSWKKYGWNPIVLDKNHTNCSESEVEYFFSLPTANHKIYEVACFLRWNAMSNIGGGWMCDYDVVNCGFLPESSKKWQSLSILQGHVPCLVYGSQTDYKKMFDIFKSESLSHTKDNHVSDMVVISKIKKREKFIKCFNFVDGYPNNKSSEVVHCSAHSCSLSKLSKKEAMLKL